MSNERHDTILALIAEQDIPTQEKLRELLCAHGYSVTQATVSRDIRRLGLQKQRTASGGCRYVRSTASPKAADQLLHDVALKIDCAMNTVVVRCQAGSAQAACTIIDRMQLTEIVGTIAGDDTIFILTRGEEQAQRLALLLESRIWG